MCNSSWVFAWFGELLLWVPDTTEARRAAVGENTLRHAPELPRAGWTAPTISSRSVYLHMVPNDERAREKRRLAQDALMALRAPVQGVCHLTDNTSIIDLSAPDAGDGTASLVFSREPSLPESGTLRDGRGRRAIPRQANAEKRSVKPGARTK